MGSLRGDVVGIAILERGGGRAVDELTLSLPDPGLIDLLLTEIGQVDGVAVEDIWVVDGERPDAGVVALTVAAEVAGAPVEQRFDVLVRGLLSALGAQWAVVIDGDTPLVTMGPVPDLGWLSAFLAGSRHLHNLRALDPMPLGLVESAGQTWRCAWRVIQAQMSDAF